MFTCSHHYDLYAWTQPRSKFGYCSHEDNLNTIIMVFHVFSLITVWSVGSNAQDFTISKTKGTRHLLDLQHLLVPGTLTLLYIWLGKWMWLSMRWAVVLSIFIEAVFSFLQQWKGYGAPARGYGTLVFRPLPFTHWAYSKEKNINMYSRETTLILL